MERIRALLKKSYGNKLNLLKQGELKAYYKPFEAGAGTEGTYSSLTLQRPSLLANVKDFQSLAFPRRTFIRGSLITILLVMIGPYVYRFLTSDFVASSDVVEPLKTVKDEPEAPEYGNHYVPRMPSFSVHYTK